LQIGNVFYKSTIAGLVNSTVLRRNGIKGSGYTYEVFSTNTVEASSERARVAVLLTPTVDDPRQAQLH
jgi:hypothetical protein